MPVLPLEQLREDILRDPTLFAQNLSVARGQFLFVRLSRAALESASFLDDRILAPDMDGRWTSFHDLAPWLAGARPSAPLHFIFHAGHVGSTLISRLLDEVGGVLGLREPLPLRALAETFDDLGAAHSLVSEADARALMGWSCTLWARSFSDTQAVVVKATSSAGRVAVELLHSLPQARAVFATLAPEPYLTTLLAGQNSYIDLRGQASERYRRLARLQAPPTRALHSLSLGELAALAWLAETLTHLASTSDHGSRIARVNFDDFLKDTEGSLRAICAHFGLSAADDALARCARSPLMMRYSKAPERSYGPGVRQQILAESRQRNAEEISRGMRWLDDMARTYHAAAEALSA